MYLTRYGIREWLGTLIIALLLSGIFIWLWRLTDIVFFCYLVGLVFIIWIAIAGFFRDPERTVTAKHNELISPADGKVRDITIIESPSEYKELFKDDSVLKIGIFLSVFNVHLNRVPCDLTVKNVIYKEGKFYDARDGRATTDNESNALLAEAHISGRNFPIVVKQISGAIAKRIVCPVNVGDTFKKGERYGMIKFGSRTEIYMPYKDWVKLKIKVGDKIKAAISVVANIAETK